MNSQLYFGSRYITGYLEGEILEEFGGDLVYKVFGKYLFDGEEAAVKESWRIYFLAESMTFRSGVRFSTALGVVKSTLDLYRARAIIEKKHYDDESLCVKVLRDLRMFCKKKSESGDSQKRIPDKELFFRMCDKMNTDTLDYLRDIVIQESDNSILNRKLFVSKKAYDLAVDSSLTPGDFRDKRFRTGRRGKVCIADVRNVLKNAEELGMLPEKGKKRRKNSVEIACCLGEEDLTLFPELELELEL